MTALVHPVPLATGVRAWFTTRAAGNLAHRRPHLPSALARARAAVAGATGVPVDAVHRMRQVHGARVGVVDASTPMGAELRDVDVLVTGEPGRALAVQVADCVPVLIAAPDRAVAAVHAGREGIHAGVIANALDALARLEGANELRAAVGPSIGPCCYEVPGELRDRVSGSRPDAAATTTWGAPSLDLPGTVRRELAAAGVELCGDWPGCTRCDPGGRWFSHRADPGAGRQIGMIVRVANEGAEAA